MGFDESVEVGYPHKADAPDLRRFDFAGGDPPIEGSHSDAGVLSRILGSQVCRFHFWNRTSRMNFETDMFRRRASAFAQVASVFGREIVKHFIWRLRLLKPVPKKTRPVCWLVFFQVVPHFLFFRRVPLEVARRIASFVASAMAR